MVFKAFFEYFPFMEIFSEKTAQLLTKLEETSGNYWNVSREVAVLLYFHAISGNCRKILEIGTSNGYSGIWMAQALKQKGEGRLITVESHAGRFELARENFAEAGLDGYVSQIKGHAPEIFPHPEISAGGFDLVFLDATKEEHSEFLKGVLPLMNEGALLIVDNVLSHREAMEPFMQMVRKNTELIFEVMSAGDGLLIGYKVPKSP